VENQITESTSVKAGDPVEIQVRLQCPAIDIEKCIGCGICEHECPVTGLRAIRITAENESRNPNRSLLLKGGS
jgi:ferredoxin